LRAHAAEIAQELVIADLSCGDFTIGSSLMEALDGARYIGCDIVPELVLHNQLKFGHERIKFQTLDIVRDELPDGHVCLIRQVFQHLSNAKIAVILPKLSKYKYIYVSEGQPLNCDGAPNPDKEIGAGVRFDWRTGRGRGLNSTCLRGT
jgi:hypothetical protein